MKSAAGGLDEAVSRAIEVKGVKVLTHSADYLDRGQLRTLVDNLNLDADLRRVAVQVGDQHRADHLEILALLLDDALQPRGERARHAIGQQHAEERADQRAADHLAEHGRRLVDVRHGLDHAEHRGDDAERRQPVGHALQRMRAMQFLMQRLLQLAAHQVLDLMRVVGVHADHPQVVADHRRHVMVGQDASGTSRRPCSSSGFSICGSSAMAPLVRRQADEEVQQAQQLDVVGLVEAAPFRIFLKPPSVCFTSCIELDMRNVPIAAPPIVSSSNGIASISGSRLPPDRM